LSEGKWDCLEGRQKCSKDPNSDFTFFSKVSADCLYWGSFKKQGSSTLVNMSLSWYASRSCVILSMKIGCISHTWGDMKDKNNYKSKSPLENVAFVSGLYDWLPHLRKFSVFFT
jgi:hypothetical protein